MLDVLGDVIIGKWIVSSLQIVGEVLEGRKPRYMKKPIKR